MSKILLVEDDQFLMKMYSKKFESAGFEVITATNGEDGLSLMQSASPDVVLMDVMMPKLNGIDALDKAKAIPAIANIPIIIFTNLSSPTDEATALEKGAVAFLVKSDLTPSEIVEKVQAIIQ